jgi:uncharacterized protein
MRVLVSGASGLVGRAVVARLLRRGDSVSPLVRREERGGVLWDPTGRRFDHEGAEGCDAVVHLAGENVAAGRWTEARKQEIHRSRVDGTRWLAQCLAGLGRRPQALVSASAIGFYGDRGDEELTEDAGSGDGFLAEVCRDWEAACGAAVGAGIRVVNLRIGIVLASHGGALSPMLPLFRFGLGGRLGDGRQWMSWIVLDDLVSIVEVAIDDEMLRGAVNAVAPGAVRNEEFTATLARVLGRPAFLHVPAFALRMGLGEMGDEMLLAGARVRPKKLEERGFRFAHPDLEGALRALLIEGASA